MLLSPANLQSSALSLVTAECALVGKSSLREKSSPSRFLFKSHTSLCAGDPNQGTSQLTDCTMP